MVFARSQRSFFPFAAAPGYAINQDAASKGMPGVLFGRYEGDSYDGGWHG